MLLRTFWRLLGCGLLLAPASTVCGQGYEGYEQLPLPTALRDARKITELRREKTKVWRQGELNPASQKVLDAYYHQFLFRAMTREEFADKITSLRLEVLKDISRAKSPELRRYLITTAYRDCASLLKRPQLHPAAHTNAVMLLGELNQVEGDSTNTVPVPLVPVTKILAQLVKQPTQPEAVRVASLNALERHTRLRGVANSAAPLSADERKVILSVALEIVQQKEVPETRTAKAHAWVRESAIRVLEGTRDAGPDKQVAAALVAVLADPKEELRVRCAAAEALAAIDPASWDPNAAKLPFATARLLIALLEHEMESLKSFVSNGTYNRGPGEGPSRRDGSMRPVFGEPNEDKDQLADPTTKESRRRLLTLLNRLQRAVVGDTKLQRSGLDKAVDDSSWSVIESAITDGIKHANELDTTVEEFGFQLLQLHDRLDESFPDPTSKKPDRERGRGRRG